MKNGPYNLIVAPENFPGKKYRGRYCYEHLFVFWKHNSFVPGKGFEIHHLNWNHRDNRIENLQLVTSDEHRKLHGKMVTEKATRLTQCGFCKNPLRKLASDIKFKTKVNKYNKLFCNRSCGAKHHFKILRDSSVDRTSDR